MTQIKWEVPPADEETAYISVLTIQDIKCYNVDRCRAIKLTIDGLKKHIDRVRDVSLFSCIRGPLEVFLGAAEPSGLRRVYQFSNYALEVTLYKDDTVTFFLVPRAANIKEESSYNNIKITVNDPTILLKNISPYNIEIKDNYSEEDGEIKDVDEDLPTIGINR